MNTLNPLVRTGYLIGAMAGGFAAARWLRLSAQGIQTTKERTRNIEALFGQGRVLSFCVIISTVGSALLGCSFLYASWYLGKAAFLGVVDGNLFGAMAVAAIGEALLHFVGSWRSENLPFPPSRAAATVTDVRQRGHVLGSGKTVVRTDDGYTSSS